MFDEDDVEVLEVTAEDKNKALQSEIEELRGKYSSSMMTKILEASYVQMPGLTQAVYYTKNAYIFSPSTDNKQCQFPMVEEMICSLIGQDISSEILLFPIVEQQPIIQIPYCSHLVPPRNHWVTLHYDTNTQIATVIDSRPLLNSLTYCFDGLKNSLSKGLKNFQRSIKEFKIIHQGLQADNIYCGAWTAINIESLAYGATIPSLTSSFTQKDIHIIIQHHIDKVFYHKKGSLRKDLINEDVIDQLKIKRSEIIEMCKVVLNYTDSASIVGLMNRRENIVLNGKPFSISNPLLPSNIKYVIADLRRKYQGLLSIKRACFPSTMKGYALKDPGRLLNNLLNIGLNRTQINQLSLMQVLFYDLVIFEVRSQIETKIQIEQIQPILSKLSEVNEITLFQGFEYLNKQNEKLREKTLSILKKMILEHYQHQIDTKMIQRLFINSFMSLKITDSIFQGKQKLKALSYMKLVESYPRKEKNQFHANDSSPNVSHQNKGGSSNGSQSYFDCLWVMMMIMCQYIIRILEMIFKKSEENRKPQPFQRN